jgi:hypothetical protein
VGVFLKVSVVILLGDNELFMKMPQKPDPNLIAPCGINCGVCYVYLREKKACLGCRGTDADKPGHCLKCRIKTCAVGKGFVFCVDCVDYPCALVKRMDKSYRTRYQVSLIEMALRLKAVGAEQFIIDEWKKWLCNTCGGVVSMHDRLCSECGEKLE